MDDRLPNRINPYLMPAPAFFKLWGIPFVCVGLYMVFGRFLMKSYLREKTVYVITNRRVFLFCRNQNIFELDNIPDVDRVLRILSGQS